MTRLVLTDSSFCASLQSTLLGSMRRTPSILILERTGHVSHLVVSAHVHHVGRTRRTDGCTTLPEYLTATLALKRGVSTRDALLSLNVAAAAPDCEHVDMKMHWKLDHPASLTRADLAARHCQLSPGLDF
jgi:hypothetical protein